MKPNTLERLSDNLVIRARATILCGIVVIAFLVIAIPAFEKWMRKLRLT
jgi:hypothetical protein